MSAVRFMKVTTNYKTYISSVIKKYPELETLPYKEALRRYFYDAYGWADFWKTNLEATGRFVCKEVVMNAEFLQKKWAREHNVSISGNWMKEILFAQIEAFKPDVLFLVDLYNDPGLAGEAREKFPFIRLLLGWDGILWEKPETYKHCDIILTCVKDTADFYERAGKKAYFHKFGFEPDVLNRLKKNAKPYEVSFSGSLIAHPDYHMSRLHMVAELSRKTKMHIWANELPEPWHIMSPPRLWQFFRHRQFQLVRDIHRAGSLNHGGVFGLDMFNVLFNSLIVFNLHGEKAPSAANMRMTEATGSGALLLTDWKKNLHEYFVPDEEVVAFRSLPEAADKVKQLLNNEKLRAKIAAAGQARTLKEYSYNRRMQVFADFIIQYI